MNISNKKRKTYSFQMPDTYVIIFFVVVFAAMLTYLVPTGKFDVYYNVYNSNNEVIEKVHTGESKKFKINNEYFLIDATSDNVFINKIGDNEPLSVINPDKAQSYEYKDNDKIKFKVIQEYGNFKNSGETNGVPLFKSGGEVGFFNFAFEGLVKGDKWGTAVGVVAFILISGGAFGIILKTGAIESGIFSMISKTKGAEVILLPILFILFSLGGAIFGMAEEAIAFSMIMIPLVIAMGYDSIVGIMITYVSTQIGFATSWMNPFSVAVAQGIAGVPILSGAGFRIILWILFTGLGVLYTMIYAKKIKKDPLKSIAYESDKYYRENFNSSDIKNEKFKIGHALVLLTITIGIGWIVWGVDTSGYYIPEIAGVFFTMGIVSGIIAVIFKLNNMTINDIAISFRKGAEDLVGAALIVGLSQGILLVLGGQSPFENTVLNTILNSISSVLFGLPAIVCAWFMYIFQSIFNFFIVSGSGQAALTMPLMSPLASMVGVSKQVSVLTFQLGDGFTNLIVPTCGSLIAILGVAKLDWKKWAKFQFKFQSLLFIASIIVISIAVIIGY